MILRQRVIPQFPLKRLDSRFISDNVFLLDEKNHRKWQKIIHDYYLSIAIYRPQYSYTDAVNKVIELGRIPHDYWQRHIMRLMAQGIYFKPSLLAERDIVILDDMPTKLQRRKPQNRKPTSPFDFVLIDPSKWSDFKPLQRFYKHLPPRPYCSTQKDSQALILDKDKAINLGYIQPNHPLYCHCLVFDVDELKGRSAFEAWKEYNLPPPNIIVKNPLADSCHYVYLLAKPIGNAKDKDDRAVKHLDAVYERMRVLLGADASYSGNRMKNPFSHKHDCFVGGAEPYSLQQLADKLDLYTQEYWQERNAERHIEPLEPLKGYLGRNHAIFENVRHVGYRNAHMSHDALFYYLLSECEQYNITHYSDNLLPAHELAQIAQSITKFCKTALRYTEKSNERFSQTQAARVRRANAKGACSKGGQARSATYDYQRRKAHEMHDKGVKIKDIAEQVGVTRKTLRNWGIYARQ